jgi:hypothetical protein
MSLRHLTWILLWRGNGRRAEGDEGGRSGKRCEHAHVSSPKKRESD